MAYRERLPINQLNKEANEARSHAKEQARELLSKPEYAKYKEASDKEVADLWQTIRNYKNPDPIEYAFFIQGKIKELNEREWLTNKVEGDAGEKK